MPSSRLSRTRPLPCQGFGGTPGTQGLALFLVSATDGPFSSFFKFIIFMLGSDVQVCYMDLFHGAEVWVSNDPVPQGVNSAL